MSIGAAMTGWLQGFHGEVRYLLVERVRDYAVGSRGPEDSEPPVPRGHRVPLTSLRWSAKVLSPGGERETGYFVFPLGSRVRGNDGLFAKV